MAELGLREQLQPGLLDRLADDERFVTVIQVAFLPERLEALGLNQRDLADILLAQNLKPIAAPTLQVASSNAAEKDLWFSAPGRSVILQQLRDLLIKPPKAPAGVKLETICRITGTATLNSHTETMDRRFFTMRRLREAVMRDLSWLLNSMSLDSTEDLERYPEVRRSVVNFGMPTLAGKPLHSIDMNATAERIALAINTFEPRLSKVHVTPHVRTSGGETFALDFKVEAELWGQPLPQHLQLRTSIDLDSGSVSVAEDSKQ